jgi:hypothetical protein
MRGTIIPRRMAELEAECRKVRGKFCRARLDSPSASHCTCGTLPKVHAVLKQTTVLS